MIEIISIIHPRNECSRRVAVKLGMHRGARIENPVIGIDVDVWHRTSDQTPSPSPDPCLRG
jgi:RimJ/RimL family protein N-acetyltransferase